jgi:hypothetical protein
MELMEINRGVVSRLNPRVQLNFSISWFSSVARVRPSSGIWPQSLDKIA